MAALLAVCGLAVVTFAALGLWYNHALGRRASDLETALYALHLQNANVAARDGKLGGVLDILRFYESGDEGSAQRGFEWRFLQSVAHQQKAAYQYQGGIAWLHHTLDGQSLLVLWARRLLGIDPGSGQVRWEVPLPEIGNAGAAAPDGSWVAVKHGCKLVLVDPVTRSTRSLEFSSDCRPGLLAVSPDSRAFACSSENNLRVWDLDRQALRFERGSKGRAIHGLDFSPDGSLLAVANEDGTVRLWDTREGNELAILRGHEALVRAVVFAAADGSLLASAGDDGTVRLWDVKARAEHKVLREHRATVHGLAVSADGKWLASGGAQGELILWDLAGVRQEWRWNGHRDRVDCLSFASDGKHLASGSNDGEVKIWDLERRQSAEARGAHAATVWVAAFAQGGRTLLAGGEDFVLKAWDVDAGPARGQLRERAALRLDSKDGVAGAVAADGQWLAVSRRDGTVEVGRLRLSDDSLELEAPVRLAGWTRPATGLSLSADGALLAAAMHTDRVSTVRVWARQLEASGGARWVEKATFAPRNLTRDLVFSPDGRLLVLVAENSSSSLWDLRAGREQAFFAKNWGQARSAAFSPDGSLLAIGLRTGGLGIWRLDDARGEGPEPAVKLAAHTRAVAAVAFLPDGRSLASASEDGTVKLWLLSEAVAGLLALETLTLAGPVNACQVLAVAPDGHSLAVGGGRGRDLGEVKVFYAPASR